MIANRLFHSWRRPEELTFYVSLRASYFSSTSFSLLNALGILVTKTFERNDLEKSKWDGSRKD